MSKIPTSKLKVPSKLGVIQENKVGHEADNKTYTTTLPKAFTRRRSKSVTDLRPLSSRPLADLKKNLNRKKSDENIKPNGAVPARAPLRRTATNPIPGNEIQKKRPKIPSWDYKSRFNHLMEDHKILVANYEQAGNKLKELETYEEILKALKNDLTYVRNENVNLIHTNTEISSENVILKNDQKLLKLENTMLKENLQETQKMYAETTELCQDQSKTLQNLTMQNQTMGEQIQILLAKREHLESQVKDMAETIEKHETLRRNLHNTIQDLKGNIRVFCRVRPPVTNHEKERLLCLLNFPSETCLEIRKSRESVNAITGKSNDLKQEFLFDQVFSPEANQEAVFTELSQLVQSALDGYNVCVFAYGQTGSGKTFTMQGTNENLGMIPKTVDLIFNAIEKLKQTNWTYIVEASFLEIYNENVKDLLQPNSCANFDIRFNEGRGITITNLTTKIVESAKCLKNLMKVAHQNRAVAATDFNEHSSRSHAVTKIDLKGYNIKNNETLLGSISLVDLAGSESAKTSSNERMVETKNINKSLSALGSVMKALHNKEHHIPYRNSKLTFLLQSSLGGNSKTLMFVNISPFEECYGESVNSLRFASQVKEVKIMSKKNRM